MSDGSVLVEILVLVLFTLGQFVFESLATGSRLLLGRDHERALVERSGWRPTLLALGLVLLRGLVEVDVHCDMHLGWLSHHLRLEPALRALPIVLKRLPNSSVIMGHLSIVIARRVREGTVRVGFRCLPLALEL